MIYDASKYYTPLYQTEWKIFLLLLNKCEKRNALVL